MSRTRRRNRSSSSISLRVIKTQTHPSLMTLLLAYDRHFRYLNGTRKKTSKKVYARLMKAIQSLPKCPQDEVNLDKLYPQGPDKIFGTGRSGAYIFQIQTTDGPLLLKYYVDAYRHNNSRRLTSSKTQQYITHNSRPFREVLCLKALSGKRGFCVVNAIYCTRLPAHWLGKYGINATNVISDVCGLAITMSLAQGIPFISLELPTDITQRTGVVRGIFCRLLYLLDRAKRVLGSSFIHNDLHPWNIIVDTSTSIHTTLRWTDEQHQPRTYSIQCPHVTIIDFDLANIDESEFQQVIQASSTSMVKSGISSVFNKIRKYKPCDKVTLDFVRKHKMSFTNILSILKNMYVYNNDIRNIYMMMSVFPDI